MHSKRLFNWSFWLLILALLLFISSIVNPVEAISVNSLRVVGVTDPAGNCSELVVQIELNRTAEVADGTANGSNVDFYYVVVFDGFGGTHYGDDLAVVYPSSGTITPIINDRLLGGFLARPARIVVYDVITNGHYPINEIQDYPVVASATVDPELFVPSCAQLPYVQDDRINRVDLEPWQTVAIYCRQNGPIDIYRINALSEGYLVIHTTRAEIDALGIPTVNTLLDVSADGAVRLYRLRTGEYQVIAPRDAFFDGYIYIWQEGDCRP